MTSPDDKSRHDLKNKLTVILGFSELLLDGAAAGDPRRSQYEEIHSAATTALALLARVFPPSCA